jgi:hypothetical protein
LSSDLGQRRSLKNCKVANYLLNGQRFNEWAEEWFPWNSYCPKCMFLGDPISYSYNQCGFPENKL